MSLPDDYLPSYAGFESYSDIGRVERRNEHLHAVSGEVNRQNPALSSRACYLLVLGYESSMVDDDVRADAASVIRAAKRNKDKTEKIIGRAAIEASKPEPLGGWSARRHHPPQEAVTASKGP